MSTQHDFGILDKLSTQSVLRRRIFAYCIDFIIVCLLMVPAAIIVGFLGLITFGAAWLLYFVLGGLVAVLYVGLTMSAKSQTIGMSSMGLRLMGSNGEHVGGVLGILHAILFYVLFVITSGFIILVPLFTPRKQMAHDLLLGTVMVNDRALR